MSARAKEGRAIPSTPFRGDADCVATVSQDRRHDLRHAQLVLSQLLARGPDVPFAEAVGRFLAERCEPRLKETTLYQRRLAAGRLIALFGTLPTRAVGQAQAAECYRRFKSKTTASLVVSFMRSVLRWAHGQGLADAVDIDPELARIHYRPRTTVILGRDAEALAAALDEHDRAAHRSACASATAVLRFLMMTGWRVGEACGMAWPNVADDFGSVFLEDSKVGPCHKILGCEPRAFIAARAQNRCGHWVFPGRDPAGHVSLRAVQQTMRRVAKMAGLVNVVPHTARHSAATRAMRLRLPEKVVQQVFGWKSPAMLKRYQHVQADDIRDAADAISLVLKAGAK